MDPAPRGFEPFLQAVEDELVAGLRGLDERHLGLLPRLLEPGADRVAVPSAARSGEGGSSRRRNGPRARRLQAPRALAIEVAAVALETERVIAIPLHDAVVAEEGSTGLALTADVTRGSMAAAEVEANHHGRKASGRA